MSVDDFATTLAYLIRVCWSAAAGQLHLASIGDSQPPSPAPQRDQPSSSPGPATMQLRAGICGQQEPGSVGAKVGLLYMYMHIYTMYVGWCLLYDFKPCVYT